MAKNLCVLSLFMPEDLFCETAFTIQYILGKKINAIILIDTYTTRFALGNSI